MRREGLLLWLLAGALSPLSTDAEEVGYAWDGHLKGRVVAATFPDGSLLRELGGASALDVESDLRLNFRAQSGRWTSSGDYQAVIIHGDTLGIARDLPIAAALGGARFPDDDRRLFDLTHTIIDDDDLLLLQRLDRLWIGYASERTVLRLGRQAITWGGGLFFSPLDIVNPFDPAAIDTEYKAGDDMLYAQYLRGNGDDIQFAYVARRDPVSGKLASGEATAAVNYHGIAGDSEYDLLLSRNYDRATIGLGANRNLGGAVLRADLLAGEADQWTVELVTNLSYSWMWWGRNLSGAIEYYFNGYGQKDGRYDPGALADNPELLRRLARRETFSLGRHYLAGGVTIELSPLWLITPNVFANLDDTSALLQLVVQHSMGDNLTFLAALDLPIGPDGSEYGGIETGLPDLYLSRSAGLFAQLAWYF